MKRIDWKYLPIVALFVLSTAVTPVFRAQDASSVTRIRTVPPDASYSVDGTEFKAPTGAIWPAGSKHTLYAQPVQYSVITKSRYTFQQWTSGNVVMQTNPATITASSSFPEWVGMFNVEYALSLVFFDCPDPTNCGSPGTITVNGAPYSGSTDVYVAAGGQATLQAFPNSGWVFVGWAQANGQVITGFQNVVTVTQPTSVYPKFQPARKITLLTDPPELQVLADRGAVYTPVTLDWGMDTVHSLAPVSPQQDKFGKYWAFQSWSDNGAPVHAYQVGSANSSATVTAKYVPAAAVTIFTQPVGLPLKIDGTSTTTTPLNPYYFTWGVGETHHLEAPAQQTDSQGRIWKFSSWSNGGAAAQDITVPIDADTTGGMKLTAVYTQMGKAIITSSLATLTVNVDGSDCPVPCTVVRDLGVTAKVTAPASIPQGDGSRLDFNGWPSGGSDYTITFNTNPQTINATYRTMNRLVAVSDPPAGATWNVNPASSDGFYGTDATVSVALTARPGYRFRRWDGDLSGTIPSGVVSMTAPRAVKAVLDTVPYIAPTGVINAAGTTPSTSLAPGSVVSIFGANLTSSTASAADGMLPQTLGGATARVGDRLLPMVFASAEQINAVLPSDLAEGQQTLAVSPPGQPDVRTTFNVARNAPGLFGTVFHEDGSVVSSDSPALTGELLTVYGTGFGPTDHPRLDGFPIPASPDYLIADSVTAQVGDAAVTVVKAFAAPGKFGIDAVQFRLPDGTGSGPLKVVVNGVESNTVTLPIQ